MRSSVLSNMFIKETSRVLKCQFSKDNSKRNFEKGNSNELFDAKQINFDDKTLKPIGSDNINRLIFAHVNINSIRNKSES